MNFAESQQYLLSLGNEVAAMKLGLDNITKLLKALGGPQNSYLKVQVAGTNGKGSVCAFLDSICREAGIRTGLYTSPHLISMTERIKINGAEIGEAEFARIAGRVRKTAEEMLQTGDVSYIPTFFEQMTAIGLVAFAEAGVEAAILETGLGGRFDATTAARAELAAITRVDLDHQGYLGDTLEKIAAEKGAIIRPDSLAVIGAQHASVKAVLDEQCRRVGVIPQTDCRASVGASEPKLKSRSAEFTTANAVYKINELGLAGKHQAENACIAVMAAERLRYDLGLPIDDDAVVRGLERARHPGRLEYQGRFLFDGAHNAGGAEALRTFLDENERRPITLIFGAMSDKSIEEILTLLAPAASSVVLTEAMNSRSAAYADLLEYLPPTLSKERVFATDNAEKALTIAAEVTPADGIMVVTGSLYLVGEIKKLLNEALPNSNF